MSTAKVAISVLVWFVFLLSLSSTALAIRVNVMPDGISNPSIQLNTAYAMPDTVLTVWGNVVGGTSPYTYEWTFGDGSDPETGAVGDPRYIAVTHAYTVMGPKYARLIVTDAASEADTDVVRIDVVPVSLDARKNLAIEKGLRYLYLHNYGTNSWQGWSAEGQYRAGAFGMEVLAFENRGHLQTNDPDDDIYAEYVQQGLNIIFSRAFVQSGVGIYFNDGTRPLYETGIALMAIVGSRDTGQVATGGVVDGMNYIEIARQTVAYLTWAQNDANGRGGWRYYPNYSSSDNSVTQWPTIGLEAAEHEWGVVAPDSVKTKLLGSWLVYSHSTNGGFGYTSSGGTNVGLTGAGICELAYCDVSYDSSAFASALQYINANWNQGLSVSSGNRGNYYAMYGVAKGCRITRDASGDLHPVSMIGTHDWQDEYDRYLVDHQYADGHWDGSNYGCPVLDTDFGILILIPAITSEPVAVIAAPDSVPASTAFAVDGSSSYHTDPDRRIVEWFWDFDASDGYSWESGPPDASGESVVCPGYDIPVEQLPATRTITLRVRDDGDPSKTDVVTKTIKIDTSNHPPIAVPGGPYAGRISEPITFDATGSYDNDPGDSVVSCEWDMNGNGLFDDDIDCAECICEMQWDMLYSGQVGLRVTDNHGAVSSITGTYVTVWTSMVDAEIANSDVFFSDTVPGVGQPVTLSAVVHGDVESDPMTDVRVRFYEGNPSNNIRIGDDQIIPALAGGERDTVSVTWIAPGDLPKVIYVLVDPDGEIEEFDEDDNQAFLQIGLASTATLRIEPPVMRFYYAYNIFGMQATIYAGEFTGGRIASEVDPNTVRINDSLVPVSSEIITDDPVFDGEVLRLDFLVAEFVDGYLPIWDTIYPVYTVVGDFTGGGSFVGANQLTITGVLAGDVNMDDAVDIGDAVFLINYIFRSGQAPQIEEAGDVNCDGRVNVGDVVHLLRYMFNEGPPPKPNGCR